MEDKLTKSEIAIAVTSYEAGYLRGCADFAKAFAAANKQTLEDATKSLGESSRKAKDEYFEALNQKLGE